MNHKKLILIPVLILTACTALAADWVAPQPGDSAILENPGLRVAVAGPGRCLAMTDAATGDNLLDPVGAPLWRLELAEGGGTLTPDRARNFRWRVTERKLELCWTGFELAAAPDLRV